MTEGVRPHGPEEVSDAERRRGIALVLDRQPEIDLDELQRILRRVGIAVDTETLVADLDALGYDVDDEPEVEWDDDVDDVDDEPEVEWDDELDEAQVEWDDDEQDDEDTGGRTWARPSLLIAAAAVLVVVVVAVFLAGRDGGDEDTTAGGQGTAAAQSDSGEPTTTGATEPVRVAPVGPGRDPALDGPETRTDDFERGGVGDFPDVGTWELLSGEWTNTDGNLDLAAPPEDGPAVAGVEVGSADVRAQVQVDRPASRAGIAFRIVDDRNLFVWAPVPEYGTTILFHVVDGEAQPVADSGVTAPGDGLPALGVNLVGDRAELLLDGVVVATYDGIGPADGATRIGVAALPGTSELPLFDQFEVLTPPDA